MTIFGAILADSYIGLYRSLLVMIIVFGIGCGFLTIAAIDFSLGIMRFFSFIAFIFICTGAGCCRCNYNVFGAVQFEIPEQMNQLNFFYSLQFCLLKSGQVIGMISFPLLREITSCFEKDNCYSFVYLIATLLMILSGFILWTGKELYTDVKPSGNVFVKLCKCVLVSEENASTF